MCWGEGVGKCVEVWEIELWLGVRVGRVAVGGVNCGQEKYGWGSLGRRFEVGRLGELGLGGVGTIGVGVGRVMVGGVEVGGGLGELGSRGGRRIGVGGLGELETEGLSGELGSGG